MKTTDHSPTRPSLPALLVFLLAGVASLTVPLLVAVLFDDVLPQSEEGLLYPVAGALAGAMGVQGLLHLAGRRGLLRQAFLAAEHRGRTIWSRLLALSLSVLRSKPPVETASRAEAAVEAARRRAEFLEVALPAALLALPNLGLMIFLAPFMALVAAGCGFGATTATVWFRRRRRAALFRIFTLRASREAGANETFHGLPKLRMAGAEARVRAHWQEKTIQLAGEEGTLTRAHAAAFAFLAGAAALSCALLFAISSRSHLSLGQFLSFFAAFGAFTAALRVIAVVWPVLWDSQALERQAHHLLDAPTDRPGRAPQAFGGEIEVRGLTFHLPSRLILNALSLHVRPGEMVVIAGRSGSGKSTLLQLLLGFAEPVSGEILYDSQNLAELDLAAVRARIGVVLQAPFFTQGSLLQNIAAGDDLTLDEAWRAAELAGLAEDIRALPMGLHSLIGPNGNQLPSGQRRRLALARALARRPDLLFLDEPAPGLDFRSRRQIWDAVEKLPLTRVVFTSHPEPPGPYRLFDLEDGRFRER
jgi:ABC-type bacteriocin/lantibiotic exporter with double-glycine peptidase domain